MFRNRKAEVESLRKAYNDACKLTGIVRNGASVVMTFVCRGEVFEVETYGTMGFDVDGLRQKAGLK